MLAFGMLPRLPSLSFPFLSFFPAMPLPGELMLTAKGGGLARLDCIDGDLNDLRMLDRAPRTGFSGLAVLLRLKRSRGSKPESAKAFALAPHADWQELAGGGLARFSSLGEC